MMASSSAHTFACHRCRQSLALPASLSDDASAGGALTQSAYDVIEAEHARAQRASSSTAPLQAAHTLQDNNVRDDDRPSRGNSLSSHLALTTSLFDMLSKTTPASSWTPPAKTPVSSAHELRKANHAHRRAAARLPLGPDDALVAAIDHPLCAECTNILLSIMDAQLDELRRERDAYLAFEDEMRKREARGATRDPSEEDGADVADSAITQADIDALLVEAEAAKSQLVAAKQDADRVASELRALEEQQRALEEEERQFWDDYSDLSREASKLSDERSSLQASLAHDRAQLNRLELANVYNDAFAIGYDGGFGTINGLRLGRMPNDPRGVEWAEINAAWGQTAFLLVTLARRLDVKFEDYAIHPTGSFTTVEKLSGDRHEKYELYGSNEWQLGRLLTDRRFDHAMVAFLDCLRQLCAHVTQRDPSVKLPHAIARDKIGGASIRLQFGSDEIWTRALRNVLMTLKILLAWTVKSDEGGSSAPMSAEADIHQ